ncbi:cytochrome P450 [Pseudomaricurvus alcaniphilus]|uniref:cytochrome P450 n=1 Tax=Pseudomaricurvus alcaniphilus TaxID=1166482 RepID=UPI00140B9362|nr:cytochrome P450 [Pseudomaricurvus alcaniphilus]NHN38222.1 cytochrome P450 [Pseudomaricurvus alcaniphilus]
MTKPAALDIPLKASYNVVSQTYKGTDIDIHEVCEAMRKKTPIYEGDFIAQFGVPTNAGLAQGTKPTFAVFNYDDVMTVLRDADTYTSGFILKGFGAAFEGGLFILGLDGEQHRKVRQLLQPAFVPATVNKWRGKMDRVIREDFLQPLVADKKANLMDFGLYFPIRIMYSLMGFPENDPEQYKQFASWSLLMAGANQIDPDKIDEAKRLGMLAAQGLYDAIKEVVVKRREEGAEGEDLIARLLRADNEGQRLTDHEVVTFVRSLLPAAGETTTRTLSCILVMLFTTPGLLERVREDRSLIPRLIDETVRYEPIATFKVRETSREVEMHGVKIPKGSFVQAMVVSANRDEKVFENPHEFNIDRKARPSFGFGFGPHMCIGQFVAKLELNCALNAMLDLYPNMRLDPDYPVPKIEGAQLRGASEVHVIWD